MDTDAPTPPSEPDAASTSRARRRVVDATVRRRILAGEELATVEQLLRGYPFACGDLVKDSKEFALVLAEWADALPSQPLEDLLRPALRGLDGSCTLGTVGALADALAAAGSWERHSELLGSFLRCRIYMAHLGSEEAAISVAADAIKIASAQDWEREGNALDVVWQTLGWLLHYADLRSLRKAGMAPDDVTLATETVVRRGARMFEFQVRRLAAESFGQTQTSDGGSRREGLHE